MAKLRCEDHFKRCVVLIPAPKQRIVRHRSGDPMCNSKNVVFGGVTMPRALVTDHGVPHSIEQAVKAIKPTVERKSRRERKRDK